MDASVFFQFGELMINSYEWNIKLLF